MKYVNGRPDRIMRLAISMMLFATCGEDEDILEKAKVETVADNIYHITYKPDNQFDGLDLVVSVRREANENNCQSLFHYHVIESVHGDTGHFTLAIN